MGKIDETNLGYLWNKIKTFVANAISGKQDTIADLDTIRSNASGAYKQPSGGIPKSDLSNDVQTSLNKADTALQPTDLADWAKAPNKPVYTPNEVGALPDDTFIPSKTSDLNNDSRFLTSEDVPSWAMQDTKPSYTADEVGALPSNTNLNNAYNIAIYYSYKLKTACGRYMILVTYDEEYVLPITAENNNTGTDKVMTDLSFDPFGQVYYYHATSTKNAESTFPNGGNPVLFTQYNLTSHLAYSFNMSGNPVARKAFYLVMSPQSDGRCKLHSTPFSQTLPTTEDGLVYKYLGIVSSSDNLMLTQDKPCYYYKDGKLRLWTGG